MKVRAQARRSLHCGGDLLAPLCRRFAGAITPVNPWHHYAEDLVAPLRRRRIGSIMPAIHRCRGNADGLRKRQCAGWLVLEWAGNVLCEEMGASVFRRRRCVRS